jgi:hypothetical protein
VFVSGAARDRLKDALFKVADHEAPHIPALPKAFDHYRWIATSWLAAGLFIGPLVGGVEPKGQRLGVNVLFIALVAVVVGSLAGEYLSIHGRLSDAASFY